jgi:hypothetical protein
MPERYRGPAVSGRSPPGRRVVVGIAVAHQARFLPERRRFIDAAAGRFGIPGSIRLINLVASS